MTCAPMPCLAIPTPALPEIAGTALSWPPSGRQSAWKPTGGFFQCPTPYLTLPWALYQHGALSFLSLRVWCGVLELPERRHDCIRNREVHYSVEELRQLLQVPRLAPVQAALHRLEEVGLLAWSSARIVCFPDPAALCGQDLPAYQTVQAQLPPWRTWMPAPRRLLRWLAREGTPGRCATAAGVLLRCLWSKGRRCVSGGRVAARWIASGFGVAERTVHRALDDLQACGWLARLPSRTPADAAQERRYGARTVINLTWDPPVPDPITATPAAAATTTVRPRAGRSTCGTSGQNQAVKHGVTQADIVEHIVEHVDILDQNLSPVPVAFDQNMSPTPPAPVLLFPVQSSDSTPFSGVDFYPFQEGTPDPIPALPACARREEHPGISHETHEEDHDTSALLTAPAHVHPPALSAALSADVLAAMVAAALAERPLAVPVDVPTARPADVPGAVPGAVPAAPAPAPAAGAPRADPAALFAAMPAAEQEEHLRAARERLLAQGFAAALLIRPALLANVYTFLAVSSPPRIPALPMPTAPGRGVETPGGAARPSTVVGCACSGAPRPSVRPGAAPTTPPRRLPQDTPSAAPSPVVQPETALPGAAPPSLRHVVPADLHDRVRLEALRQQAITRRWLTGSAADRLTFVTAAVHARRVGDNPCALFVAIVQAQRWALLTDGDEDQARALLTGPQPASAPPRAAATPAPACSDDARLVRLALPVLRQVAAHADLFAAMHEQYPEWTRPRWDAALAEALGRHVGEGMECLGRGLEGAE